MCSFLLMVHCIYGHTDQDSTRYRRAFVAFPLGYYSPETRIGIGAAGAINFKMNRLDSISPSSQITFGIGTTQNKQSSFSLPFALYWKQRLHTITGEFSFNDYSYYYYGIGGGNESGAKAKYNVQFPLFRVNYLRKLKKHVFIGMRWWYEDYRISTFEKNNAIADSFPGVNGGVTSGPGLVMLFDSRDNVYYSKKGMYLEVVLHNQLDAWGSDFAYNRLRFDLRYFHPVNQRWTIASNIFCDFISGDVPFSQMASLGSGRRGRGFYQGRFRDKNMILYQGEMRGTLDKSWAVTAFWNYAVLSNTVDNFSLKNDHASIGFGLRYAFDKSNRSNLRLDFAWPVFSESYVHDTEDGPKVYFTVNESF